MRKGRKGLVVIAAKDEIAQGGREGWDELVEGFSKCKVSKRSGEWVQGNIEAGTQGQATKGDWERAEGVSKF